MYHFFFLLSCVKEETLDKIKSCISYWRSGYWETSYGYLDSGVFYDAVMDETVDFQGVFNVHDRGEGVTFSINPYGDLFYYSFYWAHSFYGKSNCTPDFLVSSNYKVSNGKLDLQVARVASDRIEVSGEHYEYNEDNDRYDYQGSIFLRQTKLILIYKLYPK